MPTRGAVNPGVLWLLATCSHGADACMLQPHPPFSTSRTVIKRSLACDHQLVGGQVVIADAALAKAAGKEKQFI